jgi:hypothetical protein
VSGFALPRFLLPGTLLVPFAGPPLTSMDMTLLPGVGRESAVFGLLWISP